MSRFLVIIAITLSAMVWTGGASAKLRWQEAKREVAGRSLTDPRLADGIEIYGRNRVIAIKTPRRIQVRVFTILGQLVSQATIGAGTSELRLARGIYIVKIGNLTQKVAL